MPLVPLQLSLALTPPNTSGTAARQFVPALALVGAGQITVGAVSSVTVNVVVQEALLLAASVAVTVMVCTPNPTSVPAAGDWLKVIPLVPLQLSLALTPPNTSGTAARQFVPALAVVGAGQITVGAVSSVTVKVVVQVALLVAASVAVTVITCMPNPTSVPAAGDWLKVIALVPLQLSLALTPPSTSGTAARQFVPALTLVGAGQLTVGAVSSVTVKVVLQVALLIAASVAVTVMVCTPNPTSVPAAGDWLKVIPLVPLQLSLALTPPNTSGTATRQFVPALALGVAEQITVGAVSSLTVKVVVQEALLVAASVAVTVITCTPNPTSVPAAGDWLKVIPLVPLQLSLALTPPNTSGTTARQFVPALALVGAGQITVGAVSSVTVKVDVQVALLVAASVAVTVITCTPNPTSVPAAGDWLKVIPLVPLQLSLALTPPNTSGTAARQFAPALALVGAGQITVGAVSSVTVKVVVQEALLVAASVAVTVMVCTPNPTSVPAVGDWLKVIPLVPLQLSLALTPPNTSGTAARQFVPALALVGAGQITVGAVSSVTVKVVVQEALLVAASVAVTVMTCVPNPTSVPAAGDWLKVIPLVPLQLSLALTPADNSSKVPMPDDLARTLLAVRQLTVGAVSSATVKVKLQVAPMVAASV